jgi:CBS domain-containing protein
VQTDYPKEAAMAKTARDIMTGSPECIGENDSILDAAKKLQKLDVGSMPICGEDNRLKGMLTDRDIVVKVLAEGRDPSSTTAGELAQGKPVTIGADDSIQLAIKTMSEHKVRRLPVIDGHDLVGIVSQADIATNAEDDDTGQLVEMISAVGS